MKRLQDKKLVIIGGTTGLGFSAAKRFAEEGALVVIVGRNADSAETASEAIGPESCATLVGDATDPQTAPKAIALCLDAKTGATIYRERLTEGTRLYASPVFANGKLYITTNLNGFFVLDAKPQFRVVQTNTFTADPGPFQATPALDRQQILIRSDHFLYCIGRNPS